MKLNVERIINERRRRGMTQKELAAEIGLTQPCISQIESGDTKLATPRTQRLLSLILGIPFEELVITEPEARAS